MSCEKTIQIECRPCRGTGLYVGFLERNGAAVQCMKCDGTGSQDFTFTPFESRKNREDVIRVFPARGLVLDNTIKGGVSYDRWKNEGLSAGSEPRENICPAGMYGKETPLYESKCKKGVPPTATVLRGVAWEHCKYLRNMKECWREYDGS